MPIIYTTERRPAFTEIIEFYQDAGLPCPLSDSAVRTAYKKRGTEKRLIQFTHNKVGPQSMVWLLSVPSAMTYYPKVGFTSLDNNFISKALHSTRDNPTKTDKINVKQNL